MYIYTCRDKGNRKARKEWYHMKRTNVSFSDLLVWCLFAHLFPRIFICPFLCLPTCLSCPFSPLFLCTCLYMPNSLYLYFSWYVSCASLCLYFSWLLASPLCLASLSLSLSLSLFCYEKLLITAFYVLSLFTSFPLKVLSRNHHTFYHDSST